MAAASVLRTPRRRSDRSARSRTTENRSVEMLEYGQMDAVINAQQVPRLVRRHQLRPVRKEFPLPIARAVQPEHRRCTPLHTRSVGDAMCSSQRRPPPSTPLTLAQAPSFSILPTQRSRTASERNFVTERIGPYSCPCLVPCGNSSLQ